MVIGYKFAAVLKGVSIHIKDGLHYKLTAGASLQDDFVSIVKTLDGLQFRFQYSGVECVLVDPQNPLSSLLIFEANDNFLKQFEANFSEQMLEIGRIELCCNMQVHIHEVLKNKYQGRKLKIFLESKFLQLLLCIEDKRESGVANCGNCKFLSRPDERRKLEYALDILNTSFASYITIPTLAKQVGMNECYLKKGFKELYGKTIFMHLQDIRMQQAKLLLQQAKSVTEVATDVGYANISSFSSAFKKNVGVMPTEYA